MSSVAYGLLIALLVLVTGLYFLSGRDERHIHDLQQRVGCLEYPHQESSVAVKKVGSRIVTTAGPTLTGCR